MDFEKAKKRYEERKAPPELLREVNKMFQKKNKMKIIVASVVAVFGVFTVTLNVNVAFAKTLLEVPGFSGIVKVLTGNRYAFHENTFDAEVDVPEIAGLKDVELQKKLNQEFRDYADTIMAGFQADVKAMKDEYGEDSGHLGVDVGYAVKTNNEKILALDLYVVNTVASSSTVHKFYTIDKKENRLITLDSLFCEGSDYVGVISPYIKSEMKRANEEEGASYWIEDEFGDNFEAIKENQNFYLNEAGNLVIVFDKYEVAPGYMGAPEFVIPNDVIESILKV